jgi:translation initiation factor IF-2
MSDTKSGDDKTLSVTPKKTLTLKRPGLEQGTVRQNFSHGRTKSVVVETKKRKFSLPGDKPEPAAAPSVFTPKPVVAAAPVAQEAPKAPPPPAERGGMVLNELSRGEMEARRRALEGSKVREVEDRQRAQEEAKRRAEDEERRKREREESARRQAEEEARLQTEAESRRRAEEEARRRAPLAAELATVDAHWRRRPRAPSGHARSGASGQAHQGRGRPPPWQADAEFGAFRRGCARPLAVVDAPPSGEVQTRAAQRAARESHA